MRAQEYFEFKYNLCQLAQLVDPSSGQEAEGAPVWLTIEEARKANLYHTREKTGLKFVMCLDENRAGIRRQRTR